MRLGEKKVERLICLKEREEVGSESDGMWLINVLRAHQFLFLTGAQS